MNRPDRDEALGTLAKRLDALLPEGVGCSYSGEPPMLYFSRVEVTQRQDGFISIFVDSIDGWESRLLAADEDGELLETATSQLRIHGWILEDED